MSLPSFLYVSSVSPPTVHVEVSNTWTVEGKTLDSYKKDDGNEYISDGYFHESEFASAPAFDILIDGIKTIDN